MYWVLACFVTQWNLYFEPQPHKCSSKIWWTPSAILYCEQWFQFNFLSGEWSQAFWATNFVLLFFLHWLLFILTCQWMLDFTKQTTIAFVALQIFITVATSSIGMWNLHVSKTNALWRTWKPLVFRHCGQWFQFNFFSGERWQAFWPTNFVQNAC